jgi:hypothetical protein
MNETDDLLEDVGGEATDRELTLVLVKLKRVLDLAGRDVELLPNMRLDVMLSYYGKPLSIRECAEILASVFTVRLLRFLVSEHGLTFPEPSSVSLYTFSPMLSTTSFRRTFPSFSHTSATLGPFNSFLITLPVILKHEKKQ